MLLAPALFMASMPCTFAQQSVSEAKPVVIPRNTPVVLLAVAEVNSNHAKAGTIVRFRVNEQVLIDGRIVIPVGSPAFATVLTATQSGIGGKDGTINLRFTHILLGHVRVPITGTVVNRKTGGPRGIGVATLGAAAVFYRGNSGKIKAGDIVETATSEDVALTAGVSASTGSASSPTQP